MDSLGLDGKVIVVTGGNRGIGAAIATLLDKLGAQVAYTDRNETTLENGFLPLRADVSDPVSMAAAIDTVEATLGPIYGIVAKAGITRDNFFPKLTEHDWDLVLDVNLKGVFNTLKPLVPRLYERKAGAIVCISSISGERGNLGQANYAAAKAGVIGFTKSLALEAARYGVRANAIAPGFIETQMTEAIPDKVKDKILAEIPFRRFGKPEEVAWAAAFLLSPVASSFVTGTVLAVNGGHYT